MATVDKSNCPVKNCFPRFLARDNPNFLPFETTLESSFKINENLELYLHSYYKIQV